MWADERMCAHSYLLNKTSGLLLFCLCTRVCVFVFVCMCELVCDGDKWVMRSLPTAVHTILSPFPFSRRGLHSVIRPVKWLFSPVLASATECLETLWTCPREKMPINSSTSSNWYIQNVFLWMYKCLCVCVFATCGISTLKAHIRFLLFQTKRRQEAEESDGEA